MRQGWMTIRRCCSCSLTVWPHIAFLTVCVHFHFIHWKLQTFVLESSDQYFVSEIGRSMQYRVTRSICLSPWEWYEWSTFWNCITSRKPSHTSRYPLSTRYRCRIVSVIGIFRYVARTAQLREFVREHSSRVFHELSKESQSLALAAGTARSKLSRRGDRLTRCRHCTYRG